MKMSETQSVTSSHHLIATEQQQSNLCLLPSQFYTSLCAPSLAWGGIANTFVIITWYIDFLHILLFTVSWSSLVLRGHWTFLARSFCTVLARSLITGTVMPEQKQRTLLQLVFFRCALHSSPNGQIVHCISGCWHMASRRTRQSRPAHQINHVIDPEAALKL